MGQSNLAAGGGRQRLRDMLSLGLYAGAAVGLRPESMIISEIIFHFGASPETNDHEVRVLVDGHDLLESFGFGGLGIDPPQFFAKQAFREGGSLLAGRCQCGVFGCGDMRVRVEISGDRVLWCPPQGRSYAFGRQSYLDAIATATASTDWETPQRHAERLVAMQDFGAMQEIGYRFEWASARMGDGKLVLSFDFSGTQQLFEIGWDQADPQDAVRQVKRWIEAFPHR